MTTLGPRFEDALLYAAHAHAGQLRKGTPIPYLAHLLAVRILDPPQDYEAILALRAFVEVYGLEPGHPLRVSTSL